jgi:hypothetical protein
VRKLMLPGDQRVASISRETGISAPTLYAGKSISEAKDSLCRQSSTNPAAGIARPSCPR